MSDRFTSFVTPRRAIQAGCVSAVLTLTAVGFAIASPTSTAASSNQPATTLLLANSEQPTTTVTQTPIASTVELPTSTIPTTTIPKTTTTIVTTPYAPKRPELYNVIAQTTDQDDLAWYATNSSIAVEGGWGSQKNEFILHEKDSAKHVDVFVWLVNHKPVNQLIVSSDPTHNLLVGSTGTYKGSQERFLQTLNVETGEPQDTWLLASDNHSFQKVPTAEVTFETP